MTTGDARAIAAPAIHATAAIVELLRRAGRAATVQVLQPRSAVQVRFTYAGRVPHAPQSTVVVVEVVGERSATIRRYVRSARRVWGWERADGLALPLDAAVIGRSLQDAVERHDRFDEPHGA